MGTFGSRSKEKLHTMHEDLQAVFNLSITRSSIDFGIAEGHRSVERQYELFKQGKSKIDGRQKKGKHNHFPSLAGDIYAYHPDVETRRLIAYDKNSLSYIAGVIDSCAKELYNTGQIEHLIRWGGNWDKDGVILLDQSFDDYPHFEIYKPNQSL
jgi:peptidoglycan LD-endopeptidase CwlK